MEAFLIVLDTRPAYLPAGAKPNSLLLMPLGTTTLLGHLQSRLSAVRHPKTTVVPIFEPDADYESAIGGPDATVDVVKPAEFGAHLSAYEPSDWLLVVDPRCFPLAELERAIPIDRFTESPCSAWHLVALESNAIGTRERIELDGSGRVRRIQRYYDEVTWTVTSGICCSLLPVSCLLRAGNLPLTSLSALRAELSARGVPSRDLPLSGGMLDLNKAGDLLQLNDRLILELDRGGTANAKGKQSGYAGERCRIHPSARLLGPVVLHDDVVVEAGARIVGPALIGAGSRVGAGATVVQSLVGPGVEIPSRNVLRHEVAVATHHKRFLRTAAHARQSSAPDDGFSVMELRGERSRRPLYPRVKAAVESIMAFAGLIVLAPLLALVAIVIRLESRGPLLFAHDREAKHGKVFRCLKFRTMYAGSQVLQRELYEKNEVDGPQFKLDDDPRVTKVGRWLRTFSIDELPQLINVAMGQMSLVGPRPLPFRENQTCVPWREGRLSVRPGITGLWQVCRHDRSAGDFHQWIYYDLLYVRHMSLLVDLKIVLATVITLGGKGHVSVSWIIPEKRLHAAA